METYLITDSIQIGKLNNAEYTNFMARVLALIDYARAETKAVYNQRTAKKKTGETPTSATA